MKRYSGFWLLLLSASLLLPACAAEVTDVMVDNNAPRDIYGKLEGWGAGGIINPPGTNAPNPKGQAIVHLQAELDAAAVFTVQFTTSPLKSTDFFSSNIPVGVIKFSVNGVTVRRKISVYSGASISGPGQVCEVEVFDETEDPNHSGPYNVGITVTRGTRGGFAIPTLQNTPDEIILAGGTHTFPIEQDAGAVLVRFDIGAGAFNTPIDFSKYEIEFLDASNSGIGRVQAPIDYIPIPPGAVNIIFQNNDANSHVRMVLGIDG